MGEISEFVNGVSTSSMLCAHGAHKESNIRPFTKSTIFIYLCLYPYIYVLIIVRISFITGECREVSTPATRYAADSDMTIT